MGTRIASRAAGLRQSAIRAMTRLAVERGGVNLSQGLCDLPTPEVVRQEACRAIEEGCNTYAPMNGTAGLRRAIAAKLERFNHLRVDPERELTVTSGATGALACALLTLLEPGERVLAFEPFYGYHLNLARLLGFGTVTLRLRRPDWAIDFAELERLLAGGTVRALLLNTPANPCGKVFRREELEWIAALCRRYDIMAITDEIYEHIVFDGREHLSLAALPGMQGRTVTISGFSKTLAMTGWRLGYVAGPAEVIEKLTLISDQLYICAPHPLQAGVERALPLLEENYYRELPARYRAKLDILAPALEQAGFEPLPLEGTYFLLAGYEKCYGKLGSMAAAERLLTERLIAAVPAESFFSDGHDQPWLRFCFAKEDCELERAARLLGG